MGSIIKIIPYLLIFGFFLNGLEVEAQVSPGQLLKGKLVENNSSIANHYFSDLLATRAKWPWVDRFEFRTETERLTTSRQEFLFRTSFLGFSRRKFEFLRHASLVESKLANYRKETYEDFYNRCLFVVSMVRNQAELDVSLARLVFYKELDSLYRIQLAAGGNPDLRDFLRNREEWLEAENNMQELRTFHQIMFEKEGYAPNTYVDIRDIVRPETIIKVIEGLSLDENMHPELAEMASDRQVLESELLLEKAKDRKILDFAQVRYSTRQDLLFENRFSVGVGLIIPWNGASRLRNQDIRVKEEEFKFERARRIETLQSELNQKKAEAKVLYVSYMFYQKREIDEDWLSTRALIEQSGQVNITDLYRLKSYDFERLEKASKLFHDLLSVYVDALYVAGKLNANTNFLEE